MLSCSFLSRHLVHARVVSVAHHPCMLWWEEVVDQVTVLYYPPRGMDDNLNTLDIRHSLCRGNRSWQGQWWLLGPCSSQKQSWGDCGEQYRKHRQGPGTWHEDLFNLFSWFGFDIISCSCVPDTLGCQGSSRQPVSYYGEDQVKPSTFKRLIWWNWLMSAESFCLGMRMPPALCQDVGIPFFCHTTFTTPAGTAWHGYKYVVTMQPSKSCLQQTGH